ncbi:murein biosynthesis integral membrane protein MurJ [Candidatus Gottesmanbacteria bacterium]|nr:murein biosynthesis integral membrane protein MurJ [Candidatus Gottesmanbacteria bacterium]
MDRVFGILTRRQRSVGSAAFVLASMVLASRVFGLIRDRMLAARFAPDELGVYFAAFRIPNLVFELLVMGALTSSFIPVFTKYLSSKREEEAWNMSSVLITVSTIIFIVLIIPLFIWAVEFSQFFAPGFSREQQAQMALFTRFLLLLQVVPLLIGNYFTGILQSFRLFLVPAAAPVVYNIGIIIGILLLTPMYGLMAPVIGAGIGAFLFMAIQLPLLHRIGYRYRPMVSLSHPGVREVGRLVGPRTIGLAASQIDTTVDLMLSSLLGARMVTVFTFAQHLQQLPVGLFGTTIAQAALPTLSLSSASEDKGQFQKIILASIHQILFFVLPISALFIVLRIPVVRLVFGASRFDWPATVLTGMTVSAFSFSLFAQAIGQVISRGFYALYDSKTPVTISVITIVGNTILSIAFIQYFGLPVWSLGLSTSLASIVNALVLLYLLDRRVGGFVRRDLLVPPIKMIVATIVMAVSLYVPLKLLDQLVFDTTRTMGLLFLTGATSLIGLSSYIFLCWVFGLGEVKELVSFLRRLRRSGSVLLEPAREVVQSDSQDKN